ncbi:oxidoreductase [Paenibacillus sp. Soil522]|uniref:oxidoreductase n=1 Tax=Paenibacillus sp. Soil522 TaxID=1736388 RepID=UPI000700C11E|nr:oxidoreductase [Paenibacillus sp. Soil522]KRE48976.1 oxidoreductase [Paenibacillus sp. Soil522]
MRKVKVGIIGYGFSGKTFHAPIIQTVEGLEISKIVSSNALKVKEDYPDVQVVPDVEQLFTDPAIDLIVITTPNTTHYPFVKQALLSGKHVVVEKPFVIHSKEAQELIEIAAAQNKIISVYQNRRWDNDFLTVKECLESGVMGEIYSYEAHYDRFRPEVTSRWREQNMEGSGMLYDLGSHLIDQALHLFGLPETVFGDVMAQRNDSVTDDYFHIILGYGRLRVILHSGSIVKSAGPKFQIHGDKGSFIKYGLDSQENSLKQGKVPGDALWGKDLEKNYGELTVNVGDMQLKGKLETKAGAYESFYNGIYDSIAESKPAPVNAADAMNTIKVIELVKKSSQEKRVVSFE